MYVYTPSLEAVTPTVFMVWLLAYFNPLALELDIYSLAHHLCKM